MSTFTYTSVKKNVLLKFLCQKHVTDSKASGKVIAVEHNRLSTYMPHFYYMDLASYSSHSNAHFTVTTCCHTYQLHLLKVQKLSSRVFKNVLTHSSSTLVLQRCKIFSYLKITILSTNKKNKVVRCH
jgi:hypothetical protein